MALCNSCGVSDNPEENPNNYDPDKYFFWHGDIEEKYDMGKHTCLCEDCFIKERENNG